MVQHTAVLSANSYPLCPRRVTWIETKREDAPALSNRVSKLGLSFKANKCSDAGAGGLGVQNTRETLPWFSLGDAGSTRPG